MKRWLGFSINRDVSDTHNIRNGSKLEDSHSLPVSLYVRVSDHFDNRFIALLTRVTRLAYLGKILLTLKMYANWDWVRNWNLAYLHGRIALKDYAGCFRSNRKFGYGLIGDLHSRVLQRLEVANQTTLKIHSETLYNLLGTPNHLTPFSPPDPHQLKTYKNHFLKVWEALNDTQASIQGLVW